MKQSYDAREQIIIDYIENRKVLDLGSGETSDRFLHEFISRHAEKVVGLEVERDRARVLIEQGYDVIVADAQDFDLGEQFDVIIAGDLIEHLTKFEGFFRCVDRHLRKNGLLLLNTPNAYSINILLRGIFDKIKFYEEHTCVFNEQLVRQLLSYFPFFKVQEVIYFNHNKPSWGGRLIRVLSCICEKYEENIMFICKKVSNKN